MMSHKITVESLVEELRSLACIASSVESVVDEEVDWFIPADSMDKDAHALLLRLGGRETNMAEGTKLDPNIRETVKGALGVLAKRIEGITDLVDMDKVGSVQTALEKVLKDGQVLLDTISTGDKKTKEMGKKDKQKSQDPPEPKSQEDQKADKNDKGQGKSSSPAAPARGGAQAPRQAGSAGEAPVQRTQESVVIVGSDVITEAQMRDPFGMGESFKRDIVRMSTAKKKVKEG